MKIPYSYTLRNLWTRKWTTLLTAGGMALVVFVFATVLMLEEGLRRTLVDTGSYDNVVVTRRSSQTEVQSIIDRAQAALLESQPAVALGNDGERLVSKETVVLVNLNKRDSGRPANVLVRGVGVAAWRDGCSGPERRRSSRDAAPPSVFAAPASAKHSGSASANGAWSASLTRVRADLIRKFGAMPTS